MKHRLLTAGAVLLLVAATMGPLASAAGASVGTAPPGASVGAIPAVPAARTMAAMAGRTPAIEQLRQQLAQRGFPALRHLLDPSASPRGSVAGARPQVATPSKWTHVPTPTFGTTSTATLGGVSCGTADNCVAVGTATSTDGTGPIAATYTGGAWTASTVPAPAGIPDSSLTSVSCTSSTFCMAVGTAAAATATPTTPTTLGKVQITPLAEQWNGSAWSIVPAPAVGYGGLGSVSCTSATFCTAVGTALVPTTTGKYVTITTVIDQWNGSTWSSSRLASTATAVRLDPAVSCTASTFCMVVGFSADLTHKTYSLFGEEWNGTTWVTTGVPSFGSTRADDPSRPGVSCVSSTLCTVVGIQLLVTGATLTARPLVEQWNGSSWSLATTPDPGGVSGLSGVDCFGPTSCVAGGFLGTVTTGTVQPLIMTWNGTTWSQASLAHWSASSGVVDVAVDGMSCFPDAQCVAVGWNGPATLSLVGSDSPSGYDEVAADGGIFAFGPPFYGSMGGKPLNQPIVGMAMTPDGGGYWEVASDGGIFAFGDAVFYGSMGGKPLNQPIVGIASTPDGGGYYEVAADGGIFAFGDAVFYGSMGGKPLNQPIVGIAVAPSGGYYEVASDGGLFAFGPGATFHGSMGGQPLAKPVVGLAVAPSGGYYEVASDGGLFAFGPGATFHGSMGGQPLAKPIVGMAINGTGGYYEVASDGGIFAFGGAPFAGSMGGKPLAQPIVGMAQ